MMISKSGLHAVLALTSLAELAEGRYAGAAAIATEIGAPQNYLGKLLQSLAREGLVESQKGMHGGFRLARDPRRIALLDVIGPIDNVSRWAGCFLSRGTCSEEHPCAVHQRWQEVRHAYLTFLEQTTLADLAGRDVRQLVGTP